MSRVYVVGTGDTKLRELEYIKGLIESAGIAAILVDVGTTGHNSTADVTPADVAAHHPAGADAVRSDDRGEAVAEMAVALEHYVRAHAAMSPESSAPVDPVAPHSSPRRCELFLWACRS